MSTQASGGAAGGAAPPAGGAGGAIPQHGEGSFEKAFSLREGPGSNVGKSKKPAGGAKPHTLRGNGRHLLVAELIVCLAICALGPLTDKHKTEGPTAFMRRAAAILLLFAILGLVATGGKAATRVAAGLGGLVTVSLLVSDRDVLTVLAAKFNSTTTGAPAGPIGPGSDAEGDTSQGSGPSSSGEIDSQPQGTKPRPA